MIYGSSERKDREGKKGKNVDKITSVVKEAKILRAPQNRG
jgi:hypothetical protein